MSRRHDVEVEQWAAPYLTDDLPLFGSLAWVEASPMARLASAVRAAIAWYEDSDPHRLSIRTDLELEAARRLDEADYAGWRQIAERVRFMGDPKCPTHAQLIERRGGAA